MDADPVLLLNRNGARMENSQIQTEHIGIYASFWENVNLVH